MLFPDSLGGHQVAVFGWLIGHLLVHEAIGTWMEEAKEEVNLGNLIDDAQTQQLNSRIGYTTVRKHIP